MASAESSIGPRMPVTLVEKIAARWPIDRWRGVTVLVACSGGADSTALLHALLELKPETSSLVVAHFNHRLRAQESDLDQAFVEELATKNGLEMRAGFATDDHIASGRDEAWLRSLRYEFLQRVAGECGARYVATAHTASDSIETSLLNFMRGTGLKGLAGIPPFRDLGPDVVLIRPMLDVWRFEVDEFLTQQQLTFRADSSNQMATYTRNRIRRQLLPFMEENFGAQVPEALLRASRIAGEAHEYIVAQARCWLDEAIIVQQANRVELRATLNERRYGAWPVVQQALNILWQQQGWSLQAMTAEHWRTMRASWEKSQIVPFVSELPGRIVWSVDTEHWSLKRTAKP